MEINQKCFNIRNTKVAVIGLGYVGLPVAVAFGKANLGKVIAFDINEVRIKELSKGKDTTLQESSEDINKADILFTSYMDDLSSANFYIVTVPTPVSDMNLPNLDCLFKASEAVGTYLSAGDIVVYESTVYPGATEEDCLPILEKFSNLKCGDDFFIGYSPERINPSDKIHKLHNTVKIVSAQSKDVLDVIAKVYGKIIDSEIYKASSIKVAEAAKIIENSQRDLNIAFVNELSKIFNLMDIDTNEVLDAASTKWNFNKYSPGLVGGHCIGVDPYYLTYKARAMGYYPEVLLAGRRINDGMSKYIAQKIVKVMIREGKPIRESKVAFLGVTFKENCSDIRNSKSLDLIRELESFNISLDINDTFADPDLFYKSNCITLLDWEDIKNNFYDVLIVSVGHSNYLDLNVMPKHDILIDIKGIYPKSESNFRL